MLKLENVQVFELRAVLVSLLSFWLCWRGSGPARRDGLWRRLGAGGSPGTEPAAQTGSQKFVLSRQELSGSRARVPYSCSVAAWRAGRRLQIV